MLAEQATVNATKGRTLQSRRSANIHVIQNWMISTSSGLLHCSGVNARRQL
jgi:hypothetical protein